MTPLQRLGPTRPWLLLVLALAFGLLGVTAVALIARATPGDGSSYIGSRPPPNIAAPDFVLVTFVDTRCTERYVRAGKVKIETRILAFLGPDSERGRLAAGEQGKLFNFTHPLYANQGLHGDERRASMRE